MKVGMAEIPLATRVRGRFAQKKSSLHALLRRDRAHGIDVDAEEDGLWRLAGEVLKDGADGLARTAPSLEHGGRSAGGGQEPHSGRTAWKSTRTLRPVAVASRRVVFHCATLEISMGDEGDISEVYA